MNTKYRYILKKHNIENFVGIGNKKEFRAEKNYLSGYFEMS